MKEGQKTMIEMTVDSVRINLATQQRVVILKALQQERYLFIWIAQPEAYAIAVELQGTPSLRPLTHDLLKSVISEFGANIASIVITDLVDEVYYAHILLDLAGKHMEIDARPSDAIALAVRAKTPIYVEDDILERAGVTLEHKDEDGKSGAEAKSEAEHVELKTGSEAEDIGLKTQSGVVREPMRLFLDAKTIKTLNVMGVDKSQLFEELLEQYEPFVLARSGLEEEVSEGDKGDEGEGEG
jgi:bifunctional DNase/RNase